MVHVEDVEGVVIGPHSDLDDYFFHVTDVDLVEGVADAGQAWETVGVVLVRTVWLGGESLEGVV